MKELWTLVKKDIRTDYPIFSNVKAALSDRKFRKKAMVQPIIFLILLFYFRLFMGFIGELYGVYEQMELQSVFLAMGYSGFIFMLILLTIPYIISKLYFSNDVETLMTLPVSTDNILRSKLIAIALSSLLYALIIVLPFMIQYGRSENMGILFYLYGVIGMITVALTTIFLLSLIIILFMKVANRFSRVKGILQFVGMAFVLLLSVGFNLYMQSQRIGEPGALAEMVRSSEKLIDTLLIVFPQATVVVQAMKNAGQISGLLYMTVAIVSTVIITVVCTKLSSPFLISGVLQNKVQTSRKVKVTSTTNERKSVSSQIAKKEILDIMKTPIYAFNTLGTALIIPILMVAPVYFSGGTSGLDIRVFQSFWQHLDLKISLWIMASIGVGLLIGLFIGTVSNPMATTFSREGKNIWLMQTLPITARDQINGRLMAGAFFQTISVLPILGLMIFILRLPLITWIPLILAAIFGGLIIGLAGMMVDMFRPKLSWDNPQEAMKQNFNVFITILIGFMYVAINGFIAYFFGQRVETSVESIQPVLIGLILMNGAVFILLYLGARKMIDSRLSKMNHE